jgi:uncharacterized membrane protein YgcG
MQCPYCQKPVLEASVQCGDCGLDLAKLDGVLGIPPVIAAGLTDPAQVLQGKSSRQVKRALEKFAMRFPQVRVAVVIENAAAVVPLRTWAWWLFNRGHFSAALDQGFMNRDILLVLDPVRHQTALTIGYGLEPFVGTRDLAGALAAGEPALEAGDWAGACEQILVALDQALAVIVGRMPRTYGVPLPMLLEGSAAEPVSPGPGVAGTTW